MAKVRAEILSPWAQDQMGNYPEITRVYALDRATDVTGTPSANIPPVPNLVALNVICEDTVLAQIEADPNYTVVWSEPENE